MHNEEFIEFDLSNEYELKEYPNMGIYAGPIRNWGDKSYQKIAIAGDKYNKNEIIVTQMIENKKEKFNQSEAIKVMIDLFAEEQYQERKLIAKTILN